MVVNLQNSSLNIKLAEECVVGLFKLSVNTIYKQELPNILRHIEPKKAAAIMSELPEMFTGLDLVSKFLPQDLNYQRNTSFYDENIYNIIQN